MAIRCPRNGAGSGPVSSKYGRIPREDWGTLGKIREDLVSVIGFLRGGVFKGGLTGEA